MHSRIRTALLWLPAALLAAGCDNGPIITPTPIGPTTTTTFTGTLTRNGGTTFQFSSLSRGAITATLTSVSPDSTLAIGMSLGTWNISTSSCQIILANDAATVGTAIVGSVSGVGDLCVRVYDAKGNVTTSQDYSVDVVHP
jgi:hypothetical protein